MKQTAVEWLVTTINQKVDFIPLDKWDEIRDIVQQAKEMEKEQIINAIDSQYNYDKWFKELPTLGEQYYNETYNK